MHDTNKSEVARIREYLACEYEATKRVFTEFTATARHDFINKRQENIASYFEELKRYVTSEEAMEIIIQAEAHIPNSSFSRDEHTL